MTAQARITQADMDRAAKFVTKVGRARVIMRLAAGEIEIIVGEQGAAASERNPFDED